MGLGQWGRSYCPMRGTVVDGFYSTGQHHPNGDKMSINRLQYQVVVQYWNKAYVKLPWTSAELLGMPHACITKERYTNLSP